MRNILPSAIAMFMIVSIVIFAPTLVPTVSGTNESSSISGSSSIPFEDCPPGTYFDNPTFPECLPCPAGTFQPNVGQEGIGACLPCPAGTFQPNFEAADISECIPCPADTFATGAVTSESECLPCPPETTSLPGSTSQNDCEPVIVDGSVPEFGLEAVLMIAILAPLMLLLVRRAKSRS